MSKMAKRWWEDCLGYIIYPESFCDSNGDGIGDLKGIESKLDYLSSLGVNLLWLCPIFASPMEDGGYDVSDYLSINPSFGTMDDLKDLIKALHSRHMRLLLDLPLNHTSSSHPWFKKALADPSSEERGYYIFKPGKKVGEDVLPPNNWEGFFDTSAWERAPYSDEFYLHLFASGMPDLNWANHKLREKMFEIASFYLDLGVDGFRLDAVSHLAKNQSYADSSLPLDALGLAYDPSQFSNRPEVLAYLNEFKEKVFSHYDCLIIGELGGSATPEEALSLTDFSSGPINMAFNFDTVWNNGAYMSIDKKDEEITTDVICLKDNFMRWYNACHKNAYMPLYWCNHDHPRVLSQYGSPRFRYESATCLLSVSLFLYGTPFIYMGEEIGMSNVSYASLEDFYSDVASKDEIERYLNLGYPPEQILAYMNRTSRVSARTPFQWGKGANASFSFKEGRFKVNHNYKEGVNVFEEESSPRSILSFYRYALSLRLRPNVNEQVLNGDLHLLDHNHPDVFAYYHDGPSRLVLLANMRDYQCYFSFYYSIQDILLHNYDDVIISDHVFALRPFEALLLKVAG